ncbi:DnaA regulatory inactivator Hda [Thioalkalivibrio denitrificans]|uniref:DnaA regulatory inactivator Hda n=1 Tax=Thioalkalivibrio denitrificans TaxID=108003 RepID=A0A1V3NLA8_9GAMM|nr:DnaA regulatory inactivator Hda [Thioalkalivibrio denitrificans]OOG25907.1 DnaA regulatory inactivator Hda [Thioalkalivibrio denitrificans]
MARQFVLDVALTEGSDFESYRVGANALAVESLRALARGEGERQVYLYGEAGTGKTHLLQAVCHEAAGQGRRAAYLPPDMLREAASGSLEGLAGLDVVCLDGVGLLCGSPAGETALFNLVNEARAGGARLVLCDRRAPRALSPGLADMASRLVWGPVFQLAPLGDGEKREVLLDRARRRGFGLPGDVADYLLRTSSRDLASLLDALERLGQASLREHRRVTLPFAREVLRAGDGS